MHIDYKHGYFLGVGTYADKDTWKQAGFTFSRIRKAWITDDQQIAERVENVRWTQRAIDHIAQKLEVAAISYELSWKADTEFNPPCPPGKAYLGYQKAGIEYALLRRDTLIADQPGLGKTIQAIGVINADEDVRQVLIVVPASLKQNWYREIDAWMTADLTFGIAEATRIDKVQVGVYKSGAKAGQPKFKNVATPDYWPDTDIVIINYDVLERFRDQVNARAWDLLICDECHALKTADSGRTLFVFGSDPAVKAGGSNIRKKLAKARADNIWFRAIDASRRVFLSGTPMLSRPIELWPFCRAFDPQGLGKKYDDYAYRYCGAWTTQHGLDVSGATNLGELQERLRSSFMVRRLKREVLPDLPPVRRSVVVLDSPEIRGMVAREDELAQALKLYESILTKNVPDAVLGEEVIRRASEYGFDEVDADNPRSRQINLKFVAAVTGLEPPAVAILFEEMATVRRELGLAKLSAVVPWVKDFLEGGEKLVLFAYHSDVVKALAEALADWNPAVIWGGTPLHKRQGQVDKFQEDETCRIFIGNIDAAGVGFTMTRGANVAFAEGDWVPAKIMQAIDRVCRIGQKAAAIFAYFLVANGSLDSRIAQTAQFKEENIEAALGA